MAALVSSPSGEQVWRGYIRERAIGRGQSGSAVLLHRPSDGHRVVVKEVNMEGLSDAQREACENEVSILRMLCHPNVLVCLDSFVSGAERPVLNIVTEYCAGGTLEARLGQVRASGDRLPEPLVFSWLVQLADALEHMHSKRVIHRDVKTANVFLASAPSHLVKLGDLGVARLLATDSFADTCIGTPFYLSPEVVRGEPYGRMSDVWSLGVVLYEMLALERPFTGENLSQLAYKICEAHFTPLPAHTRAHYSPQLCNLVRGMLRKEASARIGLGDFLASELVRSKLPRVVGIDDGRLYATPRTVARTRSGSPGGGTGFSGTGSAGMLMAGMPMRLSTVSSDWPSVVSTSSAGSSPGGSRPSSIQGRMRRLLSARAILGGSSSAAGAGPSSGSRSWAVHSSRSSPISSPHAVSGALTTLASPITSVAARVRIYKAEPDVGRVSRARSPGASATDDDEENDVGSIDKLADMQLPGVPSPSRVHPTPRRDRATPARSSTEIADTIISAARTARSVDNGIDGRGRARAGGSSVPTQALDKLDLSALPSSAAAGMALAAGPTSGTSTHSASPAITPLNDPVDVVERFSPADAPAPSVPLPPQVAHEPAAGATSGPGPAAGSPGSEMSYSDSSPDGMSGSPARRGGGMQESERELEMCRRHRRMLEVLAEHAQLAYSSRADLEHALGPSLAPDVRIEGGGAHASGVGVTGRTSTIAVLDWLARALEGAELVIDAPALASNARETVALVSARLPMPGADTIELAPAPTRAARTRVKHADADGDRPVGQEGAEENPGTDTDSDADADGGEAEQGELVRIGTKLRWDGVRVQRVLLVLGRSEGMRLAQDDSRVRLTGGARILGPAARSPARSPARTAPHAPPRAAPLTSSSPQRAGGARVAAVPPGGGAGGAVDRIFSSLSVGLSAVSQLMRSVSHMPAMSAPTSPSRHAVTPAPDARAPGGAESPARAPPSPPRLRRPAVFPAPVLYVRVLSARRLNNINALRASLNPYVTLRVGATKHRTPTVRNSTSPDWSAAARTRQLSAGGGSALPPSEGFRFELPRGGVRAAVLEVTIKDHSKFGKNEWLAAYRLPVSTVPPHTGATGEYVRLTLQLPARRVRGSDAVDIAFGTELILELKLDDMEGWWDAEEAGLNGELGHIVIGHRHSDVSTEALTAPHACTESADGKHASAAWAPAGGRNVGIIAVDDDETAELLDGTATFPSRAQLQAHMRWRTPCLPALPSGGPRRHARLRRASGGSATRSGPHA